MNTFLRIFIVGMALFSMFFGGGNLTFPLWVGSETSSVALSSFGFFLTGVLLPFYGISISLYFKGDYEAYLNTFGKTIGALLVFALLLFWIPLGSGPRCNQLAYGAFASYTGWNVSFWVYSLAYSAVVYILTFRENCVIEILGKFITPILIVALLFLIGAIFFIPPSEAAVATTTISQSKDLASGFFAGYHTMDFIAAIFFSSTIITLIKESQKERFKFSMVRNACILAMVLLSTVYIGLISIGYANAAVLVNVPKDRLLAVIGQQLFNERLQIIIFAIITLSVLSTSIALSVVFSDYLRKTIFRDKVSHPICLFIVVALSFFMSIIGFDKLAVLISYAMSILYPFLLLVTTVAFAKSIWSKRTRAETIS